MSPIQYELAQFIGGIALAQSHLQTLFEKEGQMKKDFKAGDRVAWLEMQGISWQPDQNTIQGPWEIQRQTGVLVHVERGLGIVAIDGANQRLASSGKTLVILRDCKRLKPKTRREWRGGWTYAKNIGGNNLVFVPDGCVGEMPVKASELCKTFTVREVVRK